MLEQLIKCINNIMYYSFIRCCINTGHCEDKWCSVASSLKLKLKWLFIMHVSSYKVLTVDVMLLQYFQQTILL